MKARFDLDGNLVLTAESIAEWVLLDYQDYEIKVEEYEEKAEEKFKSVEDVNRKWEEIMKAGKITPVNPLNYWGGGSGIIFNPNDGIK